MNIQVLIECGINQWNAGANESSTQCNRVEIALSALPRDSTTLAGII